MEFQQEEVNTFLKLFHSTRNKIANFDGCTQLELLNSVEKNYIYFTYSTWKTPEHLENYRNSELFRETWAKTKVLFKSKPEAWSLNKSSTTEYGNGN